jgi:hypothetical protein
MAIVAIGFFAWAALLWWKAPRVEMAAQSVMPVQLPATFAATPEAYKALGSGSFSVVRKPPQVQLPSLSDDLLFCGINQRPDAGADAPVIHLAIKGEEEVVAAPAGARRYLLFDRERATYRFSPDNRETNLWVVPEPLEAEGEMRFEVGMSTHDGLLVTEPASLASLTLPYTPYSVRMRGAWMLGDLRVDNSLLARQRARWFGEDLFLGRHGGRGFALAEGRERIDFGESPNLYSCFVSLGESLIWKKGRWRQAAGEKTRGYPLLHLRKLDERLAVFDLWDGEGKGKISLSLMKSRSGWAPTGGRGALRFVAAKTWSQLVLECGAQRIEVAPSDWLLFVDAGLRKLESLEEIDAYVNGALAGELLVIEGLERREGRQVLVTRVYNGARSESEERLIALTSAVSNPPPRIEGAKPAPEPEGDPSLLDLPEMIRGMIAEGGR